MQVCGTVSRLKHSNNVGVSHGVWPAGVDKLGVELEGALSFVTSDFQPQLIGRDNTIMPCQSGTSSAM